jgi:endoribonuclease Dicer
VITSYLVLVHDIILASGEDNVPTIAARRASLFALDALEGDAAFLTRTCDCRTISQAKKKRKQKRLENVLLDFEEEEEKDILAVEKVLTGVGNTGSGRASQEVELEEGMILE